MQKQTPLPEGFAVRWVDDAHTAVLAVYPKIWTMEQGYVALDCIADLLDQAAVERVTVFFDLGESDLPKEAQAHFRKLVNNRFLAHSHLYETVSVIRDNRVAETLIDIFSRLNAIFSAKKISHARALDEAYRSRGILPSDPPVEEQPDQE